MWSLQWAMLKTILCSRAAVFLDLIDKEEGIVVL